MWARERTYTHWHKQNWNSYIDYENYKKIKEK